MYVLVTDETFRLLVASEWHLFIDSLQTSLKAVLLHNGRIIPFIPIDHSINLNVTYDNTDILLKAIK